MAQQITNYQLPVTSYQSQRFLVPMRGQETVVPHPRLPPRWHPVSASKSAHPLGPAHQEVEQRAQEMGEQNNENPSQLVIALAGFFGGAIHQHPNPKHRAEHRQAESCQGEQQSEDSEHPNHNISFRLPSGGRFGLRRHTGPRESQSLIPARVIYNSP